MPMFIVSIVSDTQNPHVYRTNILEPHHLRFKIGKTFHLSIYISQRGMCLASVDHGYRVQSKQ